MPVSEGRAGAFGPRALPEEMAEEAAREARWAARGAVGPGRPGMRVYVIASREPAGQAAASRLRAAGFDPVLVTGAARHNPRLRLRELLRCSGAAVAEGWDDGDAFCATERRTAWDLGMRLGTVASWAGPVTDAFADGGR